SDLRIGQGDDLAPASRSARRSLAGLILAAVVSVLAGCGGAGSGGAGPASASATPGSTTAPAAHTAAVPVSARPGCGSYCEQAGATAGDAPPGYPCPHSGCLSCPATHCMSVLS